jgi:hypothetical protein
MPDPFRGYRPGDPIPRDAGAYNAFSIAARQARDNTLNLKAASPGFRQGDVILVRNDSGTDLLRRSILGLSAPIFDPAYAEDAFLRDVAFSGVVPTDQHHGKFAILLEAAKAGRYARAWVSGVCTVRLNLVNPDHQCAEVASGDTFALNSTADGSCQILWVEPDDAYDGGYDPDYYDCGYDDGYGYGYGYGGVTKWAVIRMGVDHEPATLARVTTECPKATSAGYGKGGRVTIQTDNGTSLADGPQTNIHVKTLVTKNIAPGANSWVFIVRALGSWWVVNVYDCGMLS